MPIISSLTSNLNSGRKIGRAATGSYGVTFNATSYATSQNSYKFTVPDGVTSISIVAIGAGGGGGQISFSSPPTRYYGGGGGGGGALVYKNNVSVTPGQVINVAVGAAGLQGYVATSTTSYISGLAGGTTTVSGSGISISAAGGAGGSSSSSTTTYPTGTGGGGGSGTGGDYSGTGGTGGTGRYNQFYLGGGGGGAAGYAGNGYRGANTQTSTGNGEGSGGSSGGAGGGGIMNSGGGMGVYGAQTSFSANGGTYWNSTVSGTGGFGGEPGPYGAFNQYGGGGGAGYYSQGIAGSGVVRIIWPGDARQFPDANVNYDSYDYNLNPYQTLLYISGDPSSGSLVDSSIYESPIIDIGSITTSTASPYLNSNTGSLYSSGSPLTIDMSSFNWNLQSLPAYTIEFWYRRINSSQAGATSFIEMYRSGNTTSPIVTIGHVESNQQYFDVRLGSASQTLDIRAGRRDVAPTYGFISYASPAHSEGASKWTHYAVTKNESGQISGYINGVLILSSANGSARSNTVNTVTIGERPGYYADIRITNTVIYTAGFSPPTKPVGRESICTLPDEVFWETPGGRTINISAGTTGNYYANAYTLFYGRAVDYEILTDPLPTGIQLYVADDKKSAIVQTTSQITSGTYEILLQATSPLSGVNSTTLLTFNVT